MKGRPESEYYQTNITKQKRECERLAKFKITRIVQDQSQFEIPESRYFIVPIPVKCHAKHRLEFDDIFVFPM